MPISSQVASGISYGKQPSATHAERAVRNALAKLDTDRANSVLLFLTPECAADPAPGLRAAARAASCTQITGCCGVGLLTDEEWVLDSPAAAAMVFAGGATLGVSHRVPAAAPHLTLTTPNAVSTTWLEQKRRRIGAVTSDELGRGPFAVWRGARVQNRGFVEIPVCGADHAVAVAQGIRVLTAPLEVAEANGFELLRLDKHSALNVLLEALPRSVKRQKRIPLHLLMCGVTFGAPLNAIRDGRFRLDHIVSADPDQQSITLTNQLQPGERLFWAMRDRLAAERDMRAAVAQCHQSLERAPDFAMLFPCLSRGPAFFGGVDRDTEILRTAFPQTPFIGFYGNGEIAPLGERSCLHQYSTVVAGFTYQS